MSEQPLVPRHIRLAAMRLTLMAPSYCMSYDVAETLAEHLLELAEARMEPVQDQSEVV